MEKLIIENLDKSYTLTFVDRDENFSEHLDEINKILIGEKDFFELENMVNEWYEDQLNENLKEVRKNLLEKIIKNNPGMKSKVENYFEENESYIEDLILERDNSNLVQDLLKNTGDIPVRIQLQSNYDCLNSPPYEGYLYETEGGYFSDVINALGLKHQKIKKHMKEYGLHLVGEENYKKNKSFADEKEIVEELVNMTCGACLLTITARLKPKDLLKWIDTEKMKSITIPKENLIGFYSSWQGGGSLFDATLKNNLELFPKNEEKTEFMTKHAIEKEDKYFYFSFCIDESGKYSIKDTYGVTDEFFGNSLEINTTEQGEKKQ